PSGYVQGKDYVGIVTDDLFQMGKQAADALAAAIGKKGKVAWIFHDAKYYVTNQRDNAFKETIEKDYPDIKIVAEAGIADPARAEEIANALLTKNPDLDGIYVTWAEPGDGDGRRLRTDRQASAGFRGGAGDYRDEAKRRRRLEGVAQSRTSAKHPR